MDNIQELPSIDEVKEVIAHNNFEYQRVYLPHGLYTPGDDRSDTLRQIFPESFAGASLLDIGSANGFFCFEAERRGAGRVVGIELKDKRFQHALVLKQLLRSKVEFLQLDILTNEADEKFDYVLFLNVLHHLKEPMHALRKLASITNQKLIIEIPTLTDPKFRQSLPFFEAILTPLLNRLPLIGVSSLLNSSIDQTFVFSPSALQRALLDHEQLFQSIQIMPSPMAPSRRILVCTK